MTRGELQRMALQYRQGFRLFEGNQWGVDPDALMFAWIAQESEWNLHAIRYEPGFYRRWVPDEVKRRSPTEAHARAFSWGLLQMMGQVAREQGFRPRYLTRLLDPATNIVLCSQYLVNDRKRNTDGTWAGALAAYNGGLRGNREPPYRRQVYIDKILARLDG